uniref:Ubiquitin-like domain-containing protein n=1 Tax=Oryza brachyantha TaxID=4533 RepID=J3MYJ6_ORYBR
MDVTFVCSGELAFKMEVGFFDTVGDIKQRLQSYRGWPAAGMSLFHNGDLLEDAGGSAACAQREGGRGRALRLRVNVVSRCGHWRAEIAVSARDEVSALREQLEERVFPLPLDGAYFFIHRQSVMDEGRSFEWHGVETGDEVVVFEGTVTRSPAY